MQSTELYQYQKQAVKRIHQLNGRVLLADEMGLGKTLEGLQWLHESKNFPAIVICPATLKWLWKSEALNHLGIHSSILHGTKPPKSQLTKTRRLTILNYDILQYWEGYIKSIKPKTLIIDECHFTKTRGALRSRITKRLSRSIPYIIAMSGTPLTNRPSELWNILNIIRPDLYPNFITYAFQYCKPTRRPWGWEYKGANNLKELHRKLSESMMIRRLKKKVLQELPDKIRSVIPMKTKHLKTYRDAENDFINWLTKQSITKANRAKRAERLVQMGYLKRLAARMKMKLVLRWVKDFLDNTNKKLVIFAIHRKIIERIHNQFPKSVVIDGRTSDRKRQQAIYNFQHNPNIRLFIGNIHAAGHGITLTASHTLAFIELDWVPGNLIQAEDRIHRIGQKESVIIYYLITKGTIEEKLCKIIQHKQNIVSSTLDGNENVNQLSVYNELERMLRKRLK